MRLLLGLLMWLGAAVGAAAQTAASSPGPLVVDVRGLVIGLPTAPVFYPALRSSAIVPARGFGLEVGGDVLFFSLGPARVGVGARGTIARGTSMDAVQSMRLVSPGLSFNFGHADGWSYLSAGLGRASMHGRLAAGSTGANTVGAAGSSGTTAGTGSASDAVPIAATLLPNADVRATASTWHVGGGARWFMRRHMGVGFDIRFHKVGQGEADGSTQATPGSTLVAVAVGLSLR